MSRKISKNSLIFLIIRYLQPFSCLATSEIFYLGGHTLFDVKMQFPSLVYITTASVNDVKAMDFIPFIVEIWDPSVYEGEGSFIVYTVFGSGVHHGMHSL